MLLNGTFNFRAGFRRRQSIPAARPISTLVQPWLSKILAKFRGPAPDANFKEEPLEGYAKGGYHPVHIGDTFRNSRYTVVRKLGWGRYSTVWLAKDEVLDRHVALKILTDMIGTGDSQLDEVPILQRIKDCDDPHPGKAHVLHMLDHFTHSGPNGTHTCLTFEVHGSTVLSLQKARSVRVLPVDLVKRFGRQMLLALDFVHQSCGIVHTDVKPDNVLMALADPEKIVENYLANSQVATRPTRTLSSHKPKYIVKSQPIPFDLEECAQNQDVTFKLADFGVSCFVEDTKYDVIYGIPLRPPEVVIGAPWSVEADIWALGCIIYELCVGRFMFNPVASDDPPLSEEESHMVLIITLLGHLPLDFIQKGRWSDTFYDTQTGELKRITIYDEAMFSIESLVDYWAPESFPKDEHPGLVDLLSKMIRICPQERETASALLQHPWLQIPSRPPLQVADALVEPEVLSPEVNNSPRLPVL